MILVRVQEGKQSLSSNPIGITFVIQYLPASELLTEPDKINRVRTIRTSDEVLVLVLWVEPEPSHKVVLIQLGSGRLVRVRHN